MRRQPSTRWCGKCVLTDKVSKTNLLSVGETVSAVLTDEVTLPLSVITVTVADIELPTAIGLP
jgi:hypothetical protein